MGHSHSSDFPLKVWLYTMALSPILFLLMVNKFNINELLKNSSSLIPLIIIGFAISLPALFLFWTFYKIIQKLPINYLLKKLILLSIGFFLITTTFHIITSAPLYYFVFDRYFMPSYYYASFILFTLIFEINKIEVS